MCIRDRNTNALPVLLPGDGMTDMGDVSDLKSQGWSFANPRDEQWADTFGTAGLPEPGDNNMFLGGERRI